jgi:Icc-related predicted phosphoesterase
VRLVCLSDTHNNPPKNIPDGDILVHAGDLTMMGKFDEIARAGDWLRSLPHKHKVVICGNHDFLFERDQYLGRHALGPDITYLQDSGATVAGLKFYGSPWTPRFFDWAFNADDEIGRHWFKIPEGIDVLITHGPPFGILDMTQRGVAAGCPQLARRILEVRPRLHVFGHIHESHGEAIRDDGWTTYVNASNGSHAEHRPVVVDLAPTNEVAA